MNEDRPVFDANEKCQLLQGVFVGSKHIIEIFDEELEKKWIQSTGETF